jgi:hypothetical protein
MFIVERKGYTRPRTRWAFTIILGILLGLSGIAGLGGLLTMHVPYATRKKK